MKVDKLVPEVYYKESRDFSYIGRLFEIVFNYMKMGGDLVKVNLDDIYINSNILDLGGLTLGFESKHNYVTKDLICVISTFTSLLKKKGTMQAVKTVVQLLCTSQGFSVNIDDAVKRSSETTYGHWKLIIRLPQGLKDIILMEDLFDYILPTGVIYEISFYGAIERSNISEISNDDDTSKSQGGILDTVIGSVYSEANDTVKNSIMSGVVVSSTKTPSI